MDLLNYSLLGPFKAIIDSSVHSSLCVNSEKGRVVETGSQVNQFYWEIKPIFFSVSASVMEAKEWVGKGKDRDP